jgi:hypothetical protein
MTDPLVSTTTQRARTAPRPGSGRLVLLSIAGIPLLVILASSWLWFFVQRGDIDLVGTLGTANQGELLSPPRQIADAALLDARGAPFELALDPPRWTLLIPYPGAVCDAQCEATLYLTRQIHIAMGKELPRIRRAFVGTLPPARTALQVDALSDGQPVPPDFSTFMQQAHPGLAVLHGERRALEQLFAEHAAQPDSWYLMDPAGWVMMRYDASVDYKDVISDLKFLLKNSNG